VEQASVRVHTIVGLKTFLGHRVTRPRQTADFKIFQHLEPFTISNTRPKCAEQTVPTAQTAPQLPTYVLEVLFF
jgi:hypothetical protein